MWNAIKTFCAFQFYQEPSNEALRQATKIALRDGVEQAVSVWDNLQIIAHRGLSGYAPENTLASVRQALELPEVDMIEIDIHLSKDQQLMVIHDFSLDRTTNQNGQICELNAQAIRTADAGQWFDPKFAGEKVPFLSEVLEFVQGKKKLLIEIKGKSSKIYKNIVPQLVDEIRKYQAEKWCIVQSFESVYLEELQTIAPDDIRYYQLVTTSAPKLLLPKTSGVHADYRFWSKPQIQQIQKQNLQTFVYTVNDLKAIKRVLFMGIDGIITNYPDRVIQLKKELNV